MGPVVLRSVNAHFKLWDDGMQDSFHETFHQAPVNNVPPISTNCTCQPDFTLGCPSACGSVTVGSCGPTQLVYQHNCLPQGCDGEPTQYCKDANCCCSAWTPIGCGTVPLGQPATSTNCNYGYEIESHQCGTNANVRCVQNPNCPMPACLGTVLNKDYTIFCATGSSTPPSSGLTQSANVTYVGTAGSPGSMANCILTGNPLSYQCQVYCQAPFFLNKTMNACINNCVPYFQKIKAGSNRNNNDGSITNLVIKCPTSNYSGGSNQITQSITNGSGDDTPHLDCNVSFNPSGITTATGTTSRPPNSVYLGRSAENFNSQDQQDGWDTWSYDLYDYYAGCNNPVSFPCFTNPPANATFCRAASYQTLIINQMYPPTIVSRCNDTNNSCQYVCNPGTSLYNGICR